MATSQQSQVNSDYDRFQKLTYEGFRQLASDPSLSKYQKIGFPDSYREGHESRIFEDIKHKLHSLQAKNKTVLDIGCGCSELPKLLINYCREHGHKLLLVDSQEMLSQLPDASFITKIAAFYPAQCESLFAEYTGKIDVILCYSVLHYIFVEYPLFDFIDRSATLLADGGEMLLGDIPNISMRKRFFSSPNGVRHHQQFTGTSEVPKVEHNVIEQQKIDDGVVMGILMRCRSNGLNSFVVPQSPELPMANRREDILIVKP